MAYAAANGHRVNSAAGKSSVNPTAYSAMETTANTGVDSTCAAVKISVKSSMHVAMYPAVKTIMHMKSIMDISAMGEIATMSIVSSIVPAREGIKERRRVPPAIINRVVRIRITVISTDISHSRGRLRRVIGTGVSVGWRLTYHRRLAGSCRWLIGGCGHCGRT